MDVGSSMDVGGSMDFDSTVSAFGAIERGHERLFGDRR
jgi:hypothetical protein